MTSVALETMVKPRVVERTSLDIESEGRNSGRNDTFMDQTTSVITNRGGRTLGESSSDESANFMELEDSAEFPEGGIKAWTVVCGSFFGSIVMLGLVNSVGAIEAYVSSHQLVDVPISERSWIFSVFAFMAYFGGIYTGPIFDMYGTKWLLPIGTITLCLGIVLTGECTSVYQFVLAFGVMTGVGDALLMTPIIGVVGQWFQKKRATALGMSSIGGSLGGVITPLLLRSLYPKIGFKWSMRALALVYFVFLVITYFCIAENRHDRNHGDNVEETHQKPFFLRAKDKLIQSLDFKLFLDKKYTSMVVGLFFLEFSILFTMTYFSSYVIGEGSDESTAFLLLTLLNASGMLGRCVPGLAADRIGRFNVLIVSALAITIANLVIWYPFGQYMKALWVFVFFYGFFAASVLALVPVCCSQLVETRRFGKAYGTINFCISFINLIGLVLGSLVIGNGGREGYHNMVLLTSCLCLCGFLCCCVARYYVGGARLVKC